jgi:hypothetical protein
LDINQRVVVLDWDGTLAVSVPAGYFPTSNSKREHKLFRQYPLTIDRNGMLGKQELYLRPGIQEFLSGLRPRYQLILWSFGVAEYLRQCMEQTHLHKYFHQIIDRETMMNAGMEIKDLYRLRGSLEQIVIVDDSNDMFGMLNPFNDIDIPTWHLDYDDQILKWFPKVIDFHFDYILNEISNTELLQVRLNLIEKFQRRSPHHM